MQIKATLLCEDIRVEVGGTLTAVGLVNERLLVGSDKNIVLPRLAFLIVVSGLRGVDRISCRHRVTRVGDPNEPPPPPMEVHVRVPDGDEHNFVFMRSPMMIGDAGVFLSMFEAQTVTETLVSNYVFRVEGPPRAPGPAASQ